MPGAFVNAEDVGEAIPRGTPAVWINADGRAVVPANLYMHLDEQGRKEIHAEMDRLEREHAEAKAKQPAPGPAPATAPVPITPADRLARSAEAVNGSLLELVERLADFRDNLSAYGPAQEAPDAQPR